MYFMIVLFLLLLFYVNGLISQSILNPPSIGANQAIIDMSKKPVLCEFLSVKDRKIPKLEPECFPSICDIAVYSDFIVDNTSTIYTNEDILKRLTNVKPVIISINRNLKYAEWSSILKPDGNKEEVKRLIDFAKAHSNVVGYLVKYLVPDIMEPVSLSLDVAKDIIPYLKELKYKPDFIVGVSLYPYAPLLKNPCITDCSSLNDVVDFYEFRTCYMNLCYPDLHNSNDPIKMRQHTNSPLYNYYMSMEEATQNLEKTMCNMEKIYYAVAIAPFDRNGSRYDYSYKDVCTNNKDFKQWCVENTEEFFNKGSYVKQQKAGINIQPIIMDDVTNACGCGSFIITRNILAGYHGMQRIPCSKADVKKTIP